MLLSLPEAADRLGVNESRVRQRIADGSLRAEKVGGRWLLDEADLAQAEERPVGRPLSTHSAWALVGVAEAFVHGNDGSVRSADDLLANVVPVVRSRSRARLRAYCERAHRALAGGNEADVALAASDLRNLLRNRADRALFSAPSVDLDDLRADDRLCPSGLSRPESGIGSAGVVEGYIRREDLGPLVKDYLLVEARESDANVFLHVVREDAPQRWESLSGALDNWLVLAADLAEHRRPREEARALELVRSCAEKGAGG